MSDIKQELGSATKFNSSFRKMKMCQYKLEIGHMKMGI